MTACFSKVADAVLSPSLLDGRKLKWLLRYRKGAVFRQESFVNGHSFSDSEPEQENAQANLGQNVCTLVSRGKEKQASSGEGTQ